MARQSEVCRFYLQGKCTRGHSCRFVHPPNRGAGHNVSRFDNGRNWDRMEGGNPYIEDNYSGRGRGGGTNWRGGGGDNWRGGSNNWRGGGGGDNWRGGSNNWRGGGGGDNWRGGSNSWRGGGGGDNWRGGSSNWRGGRGGDNGRGGSSNWRGGGDNWRGGRGGSNNWRGGRGGGNNWRGTGGGGQNWRGGERGGGDNWERGIGQNWRGRGRGDNWGVGRGGGQNWSGGSNNWKGGRNWATDGSSTNLPDWQMGVDEVSDMNIDDATVPDADKIVAIIKEDLLVWEKSGLWPMSCYTPFYLCPNLPDLEDYSMEEIRYLAYLSINDSQHYLDTFKRLYDQQKLLWNQYQSITPNDITQFVSGQQTNASSSYDKTPAISRNPFHTAMPTPVKDLFGVKEMKHFQSLQTSSTASGDTVSNHKLKQEEIDSYNAPQFLAGHIPETPPTDDLCK